MEVTKFSFEIIMEKFGYVNLLVFASAFCCFLIAGQNTGKRLVTSAIAIRLSE